MWTKVYSFGPTFGVTPPSRGGRTRGISSRCDASKPGSGQPGPGPAAGPSAALVAAGAAVATVGALAGIAVTQKTRLGVDAETKSSLEEHRNEIEALKRMQREAFHEILTLRAQGADGGARAGSGLSKLGTGAALLTGEISLAHGLQPRALRGPDGPGFAAEEGLAMGYEVRLKAEVGERSRGPLFTLVQAAGSFAEPAFQLDKLLFRASLRPGADVFVAPRGCNAGDMVPTLNPGDGMGLTDLARTGCTAHQLCEGPGAALQLRGESRALGPTVLSLATLTRAPDSPLSGTVHSVLAQACAAPTEWLSAAVVAMAQRLDPAEGSRDLAFQVIPTLGSMVRSALPGGQPTMDGIMRTRAGASFAAVLARGTAQLSGWLLACGDHAGRGDDPWASAEWGLKLSRPVADGGMMCVAVGRRRPPNACVDLVGADDRPDRISAEVSVTQPLKDGLVITPGLVGSLTDSGPSMTVCIGWKWGFL